MVRQFFRRAFSQLEARQVAASKQKIRKTDKKLRAFVHDVTATLLDGKRHQTPGFGTFSTCTRKATVDRVACKMAMFRASTELREYASGGSPPPVSGPHGDVVSVIITAIQSDQGFDLPLLVRMALLCLHVRKPKLIFIVCV